MKSSATSTPLYNYRTPNKAVVVAEEEDHHHNNNNQREKNGKIPKQRHPGGVSVAPPGKKPAPEPPKKLERTSTEDVNASAEAFIQKFRQQLFLQRLESIENYEQMLKRGT